MIKTRKARKILGYMLIEHKAGIEIINNIDFINKYQKVLKMSPSETASCLQYLKNEGYILFLSSDINGEKDRFALTYKGLNKNTFVFWDIVNSLIARVIIPIALSIATTLITLSLK